jgi:hypothetical protein
MRENTSKILAAIFYPQILLFPRDKYPDLYEFLGTTSEGAEWRFKNREALRLARCRVGRSWPIRASVRTGKWFGEYWMVPLAIGLIATIPIAALGGYANEKMVKLCIYEYRHYVIVDRPENFFEATFTYWNGREVTYRKLNDEGKKCQAYKWLTEDLKTTTSAEDRALDRFYPAYHTWGPKQCIEFD